MRWDELFDGFAWLPGQLDAPLNQAEQDVLDAGAWLSGTVLFPNDFFRRRRRQRVTVVQSVAQFVEVFTFKPDVVGAKV